MMKTKVKSQKRLSWEFRDWSGACATEKWRTENLSLTRRISKDYKKEERWWHSWCERYINKDGDWVGREEVTYVVGDKA